MFRWQLLSFYNPFYLFAWWSFILLMDWSFHLQWVYCNSVFLHCLVWLWYQSIWSCAVFNDSFNVTPFQPSPPGSSGDLCVRIAWHKVTSVQLSEYCKLVADTLPPPPTEAFFCTNPECTAHLSELEHYCNSLCNTLQASAELTLPHTRQGRHILGWNDTASHLKSNANFWHRVWKEAGSLCSGVLSEIKQHSCSRFKYAVRRLKRREKFIKRSKLANALNSKNTTEFWSQIKRINRNNTAPSAPSVDSVSGIANVFLRIFLTLIPLIHVMNSYVLLLIKICCHFLFHMKLFALH